MPGNAAPVLQIGRDVEPKRGEEEDAEELGFCARRCSNLGHRSKTGAEGGAVVSPMPREAGPIKREVPNVEPLLKQWKPRFNN